MKVIGVSTQLFVWSQVSHNKNIREILEEAALAGYEAVETNLDVVSSEDRMKQFGNILNELSLKPSSFYSGGAFHEEDLAKLSVERILKNAEFAVGLSCHSITVNPDPIGREKTDDELKVQAEYLNRLGEGLKRKDLFLAIHNHTPEMNNNAREFRSYCDMTDPELVSVCLDVHWTYRAGIDPFLITEEYGSRIKALHIRNSANGIWSEALGDGDIDYRAYAKLLEKVNYNGWITVELAYEPRTEVTRSLVENARISREYVREVFGV